MFSVDGLAWDIPCDIERVSEVSSSEISGLLLDKTYFNDVLGTYMRYDITLAVPVGDEGKYAAIYEQLTAPQEGHDFVLPYNSGTINLHGRVEQVSDVYVRMPGGGTHWRGIKVTVAANHPSKTVTLQEAIAYGGVPLVPGGETAAVGDRYMFTAAGWTPVQYDDADEKGY